MAAETNLDADRLAGRSVLDIGTFDALDALSAGELGECFDVVVCRGMLHRVSDPVAVLTVLASVLEPDGEIILETYGSTLGDTAALEIHGSDDLYAGDDLVYWGFPVEGLRRLARQAGLRSVELAEETLIDGHPRIVAVLRRGLHAVAVQPPAINRRSARSDQSEPAVTPSPSRS